MQVDNDLLLKFYETTIYRRDIERNEKTDLIEVLGFDSMKIMELLSMIEDSLDISIPSIS